MSQVSATYRETLEKLEQDALDEPDRLFALSYLRSHLDLISDDPLQIPLHLALKEAVESTFDADKMSQNDRNEVLALIEQLQRSI